MGVLCIALGFYLLISGLVLLLAEAFSSNKGDKPAPLDYDNRWPGYPRVPGDYGYSRFTKGRMGNLPSQRLVVTGIQQTEWIDDEC
jgi:hypothetical protein